MGLFSKMVSKVADSIPAVKATKEKASSVMDPLPELHTKGKPDSEGLYPGEIVLLYLADSSLTGYEPSLVRAEDYGVSNPEKKLKELEKKGYIAVGDARSALPLMKMDELKGLADRLGVKRSGKKATLIAAISEADIEELNRIVEGRAWVLTEAGKAAIKRNAYVPFFLERHPYDVSIADFWKVSETCIAHPKTKYRDVVYRQMDREKNRASRAIIKDPINASYEGWRYCECLKAMALFIEEEGSSYINAADLYFQYVFETINVRAGLTFGHRASFTQKNGKIGRREANEIIDGFCDDCSLVPFQEKDLLRLKEEAGIEDSAFRTALMTSFERAEHRGFMSEEDAASFIILELSGENDSARKVCEEAAKKDLKAMKIRTSIF